MSEQQKPRWQGWARRPGHPFEKIDGTLASLRADCYNLLMEKVALRGHAEMDHEYMILPEGEYPPIQTTYKDRMMRPAR